MTNEQTDGPLDRRIREAAQSYHEPPEVPREAMWQAIRAQRTTPRAVPRRQLPWMVWPMAAAAAVALLAVGIAIGRGLPDAATDPAPVVADAADSAGTRPVSTALAVATAEHLAQTETFLTLFRDAVRDEGVNAQASGTARHLLAATRLLRDTPVSADPTLKALLEDLELLLAQISQLREDSWEGETDLITDGLEQRAVLTRLQSLVPAGTPRTGMRL